MQPNPSHPPLHVCHCGCDAAAEPVVDDDVSVGGTEGVSMLECEKDISPWAMRAFSELDWSLKVTFFGSMRRAMTESPIVPANATHLAFSLKSLDNQPKTFSLKIPQEIR